MISGVFVCPSKPVVSAMLRITIVAMVFGIFPTLAQQGSGSAAPKPRPEDVATPESIINAIYDTVSGPAGQKRDWDRFRSLFASGGRAITTLTQPDGTLATRVLDVEGYIGFAGKVFETRSFFEREAARKTESYGPITHVFSTYELRQAKDDPKPSGRGIDSFQLFNDGHRWWVLTMYWTGEDPKNPIPEKYLH
jgi:hypothetical protein